MIRIKGNNIILETIRSGMVLKTGDVAELLYYGEKLSGDFGYAQIGGDNSKNRNSADDFYSEKRLVSSCGDGTNRETMINFVSADGSSIFRPILKSYKILKEKPQLQGMRSSYGESECLQLIYEDEYSHVTAEQYFSVFADSDVIATYIKLNNDGDGEIRVKRLMSLQLDLGFGKFTARTLNGRYGMERQVETREITPGTFGLSSFSGVSSNSANPYLQITKGGVHGYTLATNLIYSGNHREIVDYSEVAGVRVMSGFSDYLCDYPVKSGRSLCSPEAIFTIGKTEEEVNFAMREFAKEHVIRPQWKNTPRPILINSWESFFFDFDEKKMLDLCDEASALGVELFVLDDGWFGERNDDASSLGDWSENKKKLGGSLGDIAEKVRSKNLDFGIWMEPEMINRNSELFRSHPEYAMTNGNREPLELRNQIVLDVTKKEVRDYVTESIVSIIEKSKAKYLKWDCNRGLYELTASGTLFYDYVIALYDILERVTAAFPDLIIEGCSAGGNRFDLGMLCYVPQIWASDNTDPRERLKIQEGTLLAYPQSSVGAHIGHNPNYHTFNSTSLKNAFAVSCMGAFGYEFDFTKSSAEDKREIANQIKFYKKYRSVMQLGKLHYADKFCNGENGIWTAVNEDKSQAVTVAVVKDYVLYAYPHRVYVDGLEENSVYDVYKVNAPEYDEEYAFSASGRDLRLAGFRIDNLFTEKNVGSDFNSVQTITFVIKRK